MQQVWPPVPLRSPEWDAKQFGNIKRFTFLLLMEERHPRLVRQGWRFLFTVSPSANPTVLSDSGLTMAGVRKPLLSLQIRPPQQFMAYPAKVR